MIIYNILKKCRVSTIFSVFVLTLILFTPVQVLARGGCFLGDTNILTDHGQIPVSQLVSGDKVVSFNTETRQKEFSTITNVSVYQENSYYLINGKTEVTGTHPFYVNRNGELHIVEVKDLKLGDELWSDDNKIVPVNSLETLDKPVFVYNLEDVTPNNSYFANDILVHNKGGGGCFLPDTQIQTPAGLKSIAALSKGDSVMSWDELTKIEQVSTIGRIDIFEVDDFYVINNKIQVTGTHPFYVVGVGGTVLKEVGELKVGDKLSNGVDDIVIDSIRHVNQKATVYNLVDVEPFNNYFADGVLVHNKGGGGGGGHSSGSGKSTPFIYMGKTYSSWFACDSIADSTGKMQCQTHFLLEYGFMFGFLILWIVLALYGGAKNQKASALKGKNFTTDQELIDYVNKIVPNFSNTYDYYYSSDTENWSPMVPPPEVSPALYQNLATVDVLRAKIQELYEKYESDWTNKNFEAMKAYMQEPYFSKQKQIFVSSFGNNSDIIYKPKVLSATPLKVDLKPDGEIVRMQINGEMIDFEVSTSGKVLSGMPNVRGFTEYWHVFIDLDKNYYLIELEN